MYAVVVSFVVSRDALGEFMPLMIENASASLRDEEGCHQFDVCTDVSRPGEVFLYELYEDAAAFDAHRSMSHFKTFDTATASMIVSKSVQTFGRVDQ